MRSAPSVGSPVVTPGCQLPPPGTESKYPQVTNAKACGANGVCVENGDAGVCVCQSGYSGEKCELLSTVVEVASGAEREVGVGVIGGDKAIQLLRKEDIPVLADVDGAVGSSVSQLAVFSIVEVILIQVCQQSSPLPLPAPLRPVTLALLFRLRL